MKPNFDRMTTKELTAYLLSHRDDVEAVTVLVSRRTPDDRPIIYPPPCTPDGVPIEENIKILELAIREQIADWENR